MKHLKLTLTLALRNLGRNKRRTVSTLATILIGLVGLAFLDGYIGYSMWGLGETIIRSGTGHVQIATSPAFFDEGDNDPFPYLFPDTKKLVKQLRRMPEVKDVVPAVTFFAVLNVGGKMETVQVRALPPEQAAANLSFLNLIEGRTLAPGDEGKIVLGRGLADKLALKPGAAVSLFAVGKGGGVNNQSYSVLGTVASTMAATDAVTVFMSLGDAQALLGTDLVPQLIVFLESTADTDAFAARLQASPPAAAPRGTVVRTWHELSPYYQQASSSYFMVLAVARFIVLLVALFSISGTLSLSVWERQREIGTLRAFGTRRPQVVLLFVFEGLFLGLAGAALGTLGGMGLTEAANALGGVKMPAQPGMTDALTIFFRPDPAHFAANAAWVVAASLVGAFFPGLFSTSKLTAELLRQEM